MFLIDSSIAESQLIAIWNYLKKDNRSTRVSIMPSLIMAAISAIGWIILIIFI